MVWSMQSTYPILDEIASEKGDSVGVYKVNVDENTDSPKNKEFSQSLQF